MKAVGFRPLSRLAPELLAGGGYSISPTWSRRGRKPQWVVDALAAGTTAGDLEIR
ncbi:H-NS family nucleoid-associated regulatory protein [Roseovarius sp. 217]|uniref:H-NS family nucleoid-associated regulatory protein n=1 Tax=Roseovarius sp. (strain 217) TaxID=314264 RepID=UPI003F8D7687